MNDRNERRDEPGHGSGLTGNSGEFTSDQDQRGEPHTGADLPGAIARRAVLRRGARLAYIVPAVLAAMSAKDAFAFS